MKRHRQFVILIFLLALSLRLIYLIEVEKNPFFYPQTKGLDGFFYHELAKDLKAGLWPSEGLSQGLPFYPYLISFIYKIFGVNSYLVRFLQIFLGSLSCIFIYFIAHKAFKDIRVARVSSLLAACYGPFLFFEGLLVPTSLAIFLICASLMLLLHFFESKKLLTLFLAGLLLGCSLLTSSVILPFILCVPIWLIWILKGKQRIIALFFYLLAVSLPMLLLSTKNLTTQQDMRLFAMHGGINFYIGNNPTADGTFRSPHGFTPNANGLIKDSSLYAKKLSKEKNLSYKDISRFWYKEAFKFIRKNPKAYLKLNWRKFLLFFNAKELHDVADYNFYKKHSLILRKFTLHLSVILGFCVFGLILNLKRFKRLSLFYVLTFSTLASCVLFFVNSRYRMLTICPLLIFCAYTLIWLFDNLKRKSFKRIFISVCVIVVLFFLTNIKIITSSNTTTTAYNLSVVYASSGNIDKAITECEKLLSVHPDLAPAHFNLGVCFYKRGQLYKARKEFKICIKLDNDYRDAYFNLGVIYYKQGKYKEALDYFNEVLSRDPDDQPTRNYLTEIQRVK